MDELEKQVDKSLKHFDGKPLETEDFKIPKYKYIDNNGDVLFEYAFIEDVPEEYAEEFRHWMRGQTCPIIDEGKFAIYAHDLERWLRWKLGKTNILIFD
jgi:hypothetical protein